MRAVKVEYTVKPEYVETNKANIQKVMDELRSLGNTGKGQENHFIVRQTTVAKAAPKTGAVK